MNTRVVTGALTLVVLSAAAVLALRAELKHRDWAQREHALLRIEMHRFGQSTLSNLAAWRTEPDAVNALAFSATNDGLFTSDVTITVTLAEGSEAHFRVDAQGTVHPIDPAAEVLARRVAGWGDDPRVQARRAAAAQVEEGTRADAGVGEGVSGEAADRPETRPITDQDL